LDGAAGFKPTSDGRRPGVERRAQIVDETLRLVAEHGLAGASMSRIAEAVGISTITAANKGLESISTLVDTAKGLTTSAYSSLGDDAASVATRKSLAAQFNTIIKQVDAMASDSGYSGKNLIAGNGLKYDSTAASQWTHVFSPRMFNDVRFGFLRRIFDRPAVSGVVGPLIVISGVAQLGSNSSANQHYEEDQFNFIENFSYTMGKHQLKFGADVDTIHVQSIDRLTLQFTFSGLTQYLNTLNGVSGYNYATLTEQFGDNTATHRTTPLNLYAEDHFQVSPKLPLSLSFVAADVRRLILIPAQKVRASLRRLLRVVIFSSADAI